MSHYAEYMKETLKVETIEDDNGFCTYEFLSDTECYIRDIYVVPALRKSNVAAGYADQVAEIAKQKGCKLLVGSVNTTIKDPTTSMKVLIAYGMKFHSTKGILLYFVKEIN